VSREGAARRFRFAPILTATVFTVVLLWIAGKVSHVLLLLFIGIMLSLYLGALAGVLQRRLRVPERWSLSAAVLISLAGLSLLFWVLVPPLIVQVRELVKVLPSYIQGWELAIDRLVARNPALAAVYTPGEHKLILALYDQLAGQFGDVVPKVIGIVHVFISLFSVCVIALYLAISPALYREWLIAFFPPIHRELVRDVLADCADSLRAYLVGLLLAMAILGALTWIGLAALGVPYALTFGVFTGLAVIIPFFGTLVSTALPAMFVITGPDGSTRAIWVIVMGIVVHLIEANIIAPKIMSHKVDLPPVLTIVFVLIVGTLLGPLGLLVAVPGLVVIMVIVRRILLTRVYEGQGFRRTTRDRPLVLRVPVSEGGVILPRSPLDVLSVLERQTTSAPV
jgi:predicted PurR-regulated permease PerM